MPVVLHTLQKESLPCKGVRVVVDVLIGMWIPRTVVNRQVDLLQWVGAVQLLERTDDGRMLRMEGKTWGRVD
jgi:hypothetical protein